jgi:large subunit ribosomal protein L18
MLTSKERFQRRKRRLRYAIRKHKNPKLRLSVYRSEQHIYAQLIDDVEGVTLVSASTLDKELKSIVSNTSNIQAAIAVGKLIAERAIKKLDPQNLPIVFDRGGYLFHGRVKALADSAREHGLKF